MWHLNLITPMLWWMRSLVQKMNWILLVEHREFSMEVFPKGFVCFASCFYILIIVTWFNSNYCFICKLFCRSFDSSDDNNEVDGDRRSSQRLHNGRDQSLSPTFCRSPVSRIKDKSTSRQQNGTMRWFLCINFFLIIKLITKKSCEVAFYLNVQKIL